MPACNRQGQKVKLSTFSTPRSTRIAKLGHGLVRRFVSLTDAFPLAIHKEEVCWNALAEAGKKDKALNTLLKALGEDLDKKKNLIDYVGFQHYELHFTEYVL